MSLVRRRVKKVEGLAPTVTTGRPCRWCHRAIWARDRQGAEYCSVTCEARHGQYERAEAAARRRAAAYVPPPLPARPPQTGR